jgi:hypothetical protein
VGLALYVAGSWYAQRIDVDALHTHTVVMEHAFRHGLASPGAARATFGHTAWSALHYELATQRTAAGRDVATATAAWAQMIAASDRWGVGTHLRLRWDPIGASPHALAPPALSIPTVPCR